MALHVHLKLLLASLKEMATLAPPTPLDLAPSQPPGGKMMSLVNVMLRPRSRLTPTGQVKLVKLMFTPLSHSSSPLLSVISLFWPHRPGRQIMLCQNPPSFSDTTSLSLQVQRSSNAGLYCFSRTRYDN